MYSSDSTAQKKQEKPIKRSGRRGGSTKPGELHEVTQERAIQQYAYSPNVIEEFSEGEDIQVIPDRPVLYSYSCSSPEPMNPIFFYVLGISLVVGTSVLLTYVQNKTAKWLTPQKPDSTTPERGSVERLEKPSSEGKGEDGLATPQFLLDTFKSYKSKVISKKKATYILTRYYHVSEATALELLDG